MTSSGVRCIVFRMMQASETITVRAIWAAALTHGVDVRTIRKALRGEPIRGVAADRARAAVRQLTSSADQK